MAFSKNNLLKELQEQADRIQKEYNFTTNTGSYQVRNSAPEINRAYGEWSRILVIIDAIRGGYLGYGDS